MNKSLLRIFALTNRNIKEILRDPLSLVFTILLPLVMEIMFYFTFHNLTSQFEMKYLAPSIVVFSQSFLTLFSGLLISLDRNTSFLTRLYVSKVKSYEFIVSYVLSVMPIALIQSILFFLVGGIIENSLFTINIISAIGLSLFTSVFFISLGILFGSICNEKSIGGISSIAIVGQSVLSGMWFPVDGLSNTFIKIMKILPFKNSTQIVQSVFIKDSLNFENFTMPLIIVLSYTIIVLISAILCFRKNMNEK